ncbi:MAG: tRNA (adenosine(37)-N6)-dimethylallyltransferase MiaA [Pseudomonadota bacterium]
MTASDIKRFKIVVISGPTGVGKTGLGIHLARHFGAEIVNADSLQVYRGLDIGTAKPTPLEQTQARHHLLDLVDPDEDFDAARYLDLARPLIQRLHDRGTRVLAVGGTGLYLRSLIKGLFKGPGGDAAVRERLKSQARAEGWPALHHRLAQVDPAAAARLHPHDRVRIERALEVHELTGRTISSFQAEHALADAPYDVLFFCLDLPREELYARIESRTRDMLDQGLLEETAGLLARGYSPDLKPLRSIGYKEAVAHLAGRATREETAREIMKQTRRFAKRQLTWHRSQPDTVWLSPRDQDRARELTAAFWGP